MIVSRLLLASFVVAVSTSHAAALRASQVRLVEEDRSPLCVPFGAGRAAQLSGIF